MLIWQDKYLKQNIYYLACLESFFSFPYALSSPRPRNTSTVPAHCLEFMGFWKIITDPKMVKNFLVVVMMEQGKGPNDVTVINMNTWNTECNKLSDIND